MKKHSIFLVFSLLLLMLWGACSNFVDEVDPLINQVEDDLLNNEQQIPFLTTGVMVRFATTHDQLVVLADGLSDQFIFDSNVPNATFPTFQDIDKGDITFDNNSIDGMFFDLGELRFFADDLVRRVTAIGTFDDADVQREALFTGHLYGGIARYFFATHMGLNPTEGGGVIDNGPFIPSAEMYNLALEKFQEALNYVGSDADTRAVNSMIARTYLYMGNSANALSFAQNGMVDGDNPFVSQHNAESTNYVWQQAGRGRNQYVVDPRFAAYVAADPNEAARIQFEEILGTDGVTIFYRQIKYPNFDTPISFMTWQENELMLAELGDNSLDRVNAVRASHGLGALSTYDQNVLITERDKELFLTGNRLPDERRFGIFHLPAGSWEFLPLTERERNNNPNL